MYRRLFLSLVTALAVTVPGPVRSEVTADQALVLARAAAIALKPELDHPDTKVRTSYSDKVIALELSDPYRLNGQIYWKNYTRYESTKSAVAQYTGIGEKVHATQAAQPMPSEVPDELRPKVLEWLAYWDAQSSLDPELRVGARLTKAHGFFFKRGGIGGPMAIIGVDADGVTFRLAVDGPLVPWDLPRSMKAQNRAELFELLYGAAR